MLRIRKRVRKETPFRSYGIRFNSIYFDPTLVGSTGTSDVTGKQTDCRYVTGKHR